MYGLLHSPEYRESFAADLKKMLPRIPKVRDFTGFAEAGRRLSELHLGYEAIEPWPLEEVLSPGDGDPLHVVKMRYQIKTDKASGIVNDPNAWGAEHGDPRYIVDLVKRITRVGVETVAIVKGLPALDIFDADAPRPN